MEYINIVTAFSALMGTLTLLGVVGLIRMDMQEKRRKSQQGHFAPKDLITRIDVIDQQGRPYTRYLNDRERLLMAIQDDGRTMKLLISDRKKKLDEEGVN